MQNLIPYGKQDITKTDIQAVVDVLTSDFLTQGPAVPAFENSLKDFIGSKFSVAISNGTGGLHIAYLAAGVRPGDAVFVPALTFAATSNAALYCGATPVFVDIDPKTLCMSPDSLEAAIALALKNNLKPKVIAPVYYAGRPMDSFAKIVALAENFNMFIVEDACHALGAQYRLTESDTFANVGNSTFADMTVFSFHPVKHITTGEGGAVTTNDPELFKRLKLFRSHGITKDESDFENRELALDKGSSECNAWYHEMQELGLNYRLTDIQATLGKSQLSRIVGNVQRRREIAAIYDHAFSGHEHLSAPPADTTLVKHSYHLYPLRFDFDKIKKSRNTVMKILRDGGVGTQVHYLPVTWHPYYQRNPKLWLSVDIKEAERFYFQELSIPMFSTLTNADVERVIGRIVGSVLC